MSSDAIKITVLNVLLVGATYLIPVSQDGDLVRLLLLITVCPLVTLIAVFFIVRDLLRREKRIQGIVACLIWFLPIAHFFWFFRRGF